jgi:SAM-dependent methyltransferase
MVAQAAGLDTACAFDAVAHDYHVTNRANPILEHMRAQAIAALRRHVPAGSSVLDLGCGPGTDHASMLGAGYRVTAIDASPEMVRQARQRAASSDAPGRPTIHWRRIEDVAAFGRGVFDAAFSNFGPLNCVGNLADAVRQVRHVVRPSGVLVASVIGRVCPWEIALYLARGDVRRATVRFRSGPVGVPLASGTVWTQYMTPASFIRVCRDAGFRLRARRALCVVAPPPYLQAFAGRRPRVVRRLLALDDLVGGWPLVRHVGDHFLVVLERESDEDALARS